MRFYVAVNVTKAQGPRKQPEDVAVELQDAIDQVEIWIDDTAYQVDVVAVRDRPDELSHPAR